MGTDKILVIDDEEAALGLFQAVLEHLGYGVLLARGGSEGLDLYSLRSSEVSLIILDLTMPGMSGAQVLTALRTISQEVLIVVSSGFDEAEVVRQCGTAADAILPKPFNIERLSRVVEQTLRTNRQPIELSKSTAQP